MDTISCWEYDSITVETNDTIWYKICDTSKQYSLAV